METFWFIILALMLTVYVVLDGFDLGAGIIHYFAAKTAAERRLIFRAIGPVWDGNEVWLVASAGILFFSFPILYASSFSGFYLPLMMVLWLLMLRAIGIELRGHIQHPLWHSLWDFVFAIASGLLAIFFGAALGNVIRGVPLNSEGYFFEPLWTNFRVGEQTGILDWFTIMTGVVAFVTLATHGANYIALKTEADVQQRARKIAIQMSRILILLTALSVPATLYVRPQMLDNYRAYIWGFLFPLLGFGSLAAMQYFHRKQHDKAAFLSSAAYIVGAMCGAAFGLYPTVLPATTGEAYSLTIYNAAAQAYGLRISIVWWAIGMTLAIAYFTYLYRSFRGKVTLETDGH